MKRLLCLSILISILFLSNCESNNNPEGVVKSALEEFVASNSISYDITYKNKYFNNDDTTELEGNCIIIREPKDTIFGGILWIKTNDSMERYYDLENIYIIDHKKKQITRFKAHNNQIGAITSVHAGVMIKIYYLEHEKFMDILKDTSEVFKMTDTVINNIEFWEIKHDYPDNADYSDMTKSIFIDRDLNLIQKIIFSVKFQNDYQYNEWNLSNIEFGNDTPSELEKRFEELKKQYPIKDYKRRDRKDSQPLNNGTDAPAFKGIFYKDNNAMDLKDYKGKALLIDFWYMACYPCVKSIPHLNNLNTKYANKGLVVLGLNRRDDSELGKRRLPAFIEYNKMNYPIVFIDSEVAKAYKVRAYPTFYIIDRVGKIAFSQVGFSENTEAIIDSVLVSILK